MIAPGLREPDEAGREAQHRLGAPARRRVDVDVVVQAPQPRRLAGREDAQVRAHPALQARVVDDVGAEHLAARTERAQRPVVRRDPPRVVVLRVHGEVRLVPRAVLADLPVAAHERPRVAVVVGRRRQAERPRAAAPERHDDRHPRGARRAHPRVELAALPAVVQRVPRDRQPRVADRAATVRRASANDAACWSAIPTTTACDGVAATSAPSTASAATIGMARRRMPARMQDRGDGHGAISACPARRPDKHSP